MKQTNQPNQPNQPNQIDELIIQLLKNSKDAFVSGQTLSNRIGITRAAVWKHIERLRGEGYIIVSAPSRGYKLIE
ncbi:MAG: HTH domain-containing protein, partial [Nitrospirae bacterium]|nr:HTH domain-containing protein [Nitrospirota bacterium]